MVFPYLTNKMWLFIDKFFPFLLLKNQNKLFKIKHNFFISKHKRDSKYTRTDDHHRIMTIIINSPMQQQFLVGNGESTRNIKLHSSFINLLHEQILRYVQLRLHEHNHRSLKSWFKPVVTHIAIYCCTSN